MKAFSGAGKRGRRDNGRKRSKCKEVKSACHSAARTNSHGYSSTSLHPALPETIVMHDGITMPDPNPSTRVLRTGATHRQRCRAFVMIETLFSRIVSSSHPKPRLLRWSQCCIRNVLHGITPTQTEAHVLSAQVCPLEGHKRTVGVRDKEKTKTTIFFCT